jgi:5-methylcytosine-specific restriction endonuclease McrA
MKDSLNQPVLVLNKNWVVVGTTSTQNAIILMFRESANALCTSSFMIYGWEQWISDEVNVPNVSNYIRTPNMNVPAPSVIILTNYNDVHISTVKFSPRALYRRDNYTCQYCNQKKRTEDLSIDHILPKSRNGKTSWENCVTACFRCNNKKSDRTPREAGLKLSKKPTRPKWNPVVHIRADYRPESWEPLLKDNW